MNICLHIKALAHLVIDEFVPILQTPPASFRRQVDLHYNSLPRQSQPSGAISSVLRGSPSISTLNNGIRAGHSVTVANTTDNNANHKQRAVAFGKQINSLQYSLPHSASKSATNIYHHQVVLYQQPGPSSPLPPRSSPPPGSHVPKQRGASLPNLGFCEYTDNFIKRVLFSFCFRLTTAWRYSAVETTFLLAFC